MTEETIQQVIKVFSAYFTMDRVKTHQGIDKHLLPKILDKREINKVLSSPVPIYNTSSKTTKMVTLLEATILMAGQFGDRNPCLVNTDPRVAEMTLCYLEDSKGEAYPLTIYGLFYSLINYVGKNPTSPEIVSKITEILKEKKTTIPSNI